MYEYEIIKCNKCNGTGRTKVECTCNECMIYNTCSECSGKGEIKIIHENVIRMNKNQKNNK